MACGGCQAKAKRLIANFKANQTADSPPQALIRCAGCNSLHTEKEHQDCPFRIQHDKQLAREARIKNLQPKVVKVEQHYIHSRRGVIPVRPNNPQIVDPTKPNQKKW